MGRPRSTTRGDIKQSWRLEDGVLTVEWAGERMTPAILELVADVSALIEKRTETVATPEEDNDG